MQCSSMREGVVMPAAHRDDSDASALPTVGFGQAVQQEAAVKVVATRLQRSALYRPFTRSGLPSGAGALGQQLYISLKPALRQGARRTWPLDLIQSMVSWVYACKAELPQVWELVIVAYGWYQPISILYAQDQSSS